MVPASPAVIFCCRAPREAELQGHRDTRLGQSGAHRLDSLLHFRAVRLELLDRLGQLCGEDRPEFLVAEVLEKCALELPEPRREQRGHLPQLCLGGPRGERGLLCDVGDPGRVQGRDAGPDVVGRAGKPCCRDAGDIAGQVAAAPRHGIHLGPAHAQRSQLALGALHLAHALDRRGGQPQGATPDRAQLTRNQRAAGRALHALVQPLLCAGDSRRRRSLALHRAGGAFDVGRDPALGVPQFAGVDAGRAELVPQVPQLVPLLAVRAPERVRLPAGGLE